MNIQELIAQLQAAAQGASNGVASNVSAPVDLINAGLGTVGAGTEDPVGGSAWMRKHGFTQQPQRQMAGAIGEGLGMAAPQALASKTPAIAGLLNQLQENASIPATMNAQRGAVYTGGNMKKSGLANPNDSAVMRSTDNALTGAGAQMDTMGMPAYEWTGKEFGRSAATLHPPGSGGKYTATAVEYNGKYTATAVEYNGKYRPMIQDTKTGRPSYTGQEMFDTPQQAADFAGEVVRGVRRGLHY